MAKVQSQEGINICPLMNLLPCGGYIGTYPPGKHYLCRQTTSSELPQRTPGCCAQHSCSHSRCVLESHCLPSHPPIRGPGGRGNGRNGRSTGPGVSPQFCSPVQPWASHSASRDCSGCLSRTRATVFTISRYYSL